MSTGSENENAASRLGNRKVSWAVVNGTVLVVLAFVLLFTGYIEGGAFVSLLTLALLVGLLTLFGDRIYQVTLFGSEIRLRRIEQDAAVAIQELRRSRIDNYRTALRLSTKHGGRSTAQGYRDERAEPLIGVVNMIGDAELTDALAQDIIDACIDVEACLTEKLAQFGKNLPETTEGVRMQSSDALPSSEQILAMHDHAAATSIAEESDDIAAVEDLRELIRLRHKAQLYV